MINLTIKILLRLLMKVILLDKKNIVAKALNNLRFKQKIVKLKKDKGS